VSALVREGGKLFSAEANFALVMGMNPFVDSPVRDPRVRQASIMTLNHQNLVQGVYNGTQATVATGLAAPSVNGYDPTLPQPRQDIAGARRMLTEAGFPNGFQSKMHVLASSAPFITAGQAVAGFLEEAGIRVEIEQVSGTAYGTLFNNGPFHPYQVINYTSVGQDSQPALDWFLSTAPAARKRYDNPNFDRAFNAAAQELDANRRLEALRQAQRILMTEQPVVAPLVWPIQGMVAKAKVEAFTVLPSNFDIDGTFITR
jgi:peptide/nickel transport system substrate-binding protein